MDKLSTQSKGIVLQGKQSPPLTVYDKKVNVIAEYLEKFATISGRAITPQLILVYIEALEDLELRVIEKGLAEYLQSGTKWPWPGELRECIEIEV